MSTERAATIARHRADQPTPVIGEPEVDLPAVARAAEQVVRQIRAQMGSRSIREVARGAGVAHGTLVKLLNGETLPGFETLVRLSEVLNVRLLASVEEPRELDEEYLWARFRAAVVPLTLDLNLVGADRCGVLRTDFAIVIKAALDLDPISCHSALEKASEARQLSPDAVFVGVLASGEPDRSTLELLRRERAIAFWPSVASGRVFVDSRGREWNPRTRQRRIS